MVLAGVSLALFGAVAPAKAVPDTCPSGRSDAGSVTVAEPAAGSVVSGVVTVKGRATGPEPLFRVELFAGESLKDFQTFEAATNTVDFSLRWDASGAGSPLNLVVVACGGRPGALFRATSSLTVRTGGPASSAAPPARLAAAPVTAGTGPRGPAWVGAIVAAGVLAGLAAGAGLRRPQGFVARLLRRVRRPVVGPDVPLA